jgi:Ca-activated chloride channel homolog
MKPTADYYKILGIRRNATPEQIKRAYLKSAQRLHPDKNTASGETELFIEAQLAYETLSNPTRRAAYDATLPPAEETDGIHSSIVYSRTTLSNTQEDQLLYVIASFTAPPLKEQDHPPLNICLTLDCSTSMQGANLDMVKATAGQIIRRLRPQDIFSVVTFSDRAEAIIPATRDSDPQKMESRLRTIQATGGTEIFQGLQTAYNEIRKFYNPAYINHIILLTDGETYGDADLCLQLSKTAANERIGISGLGIGKDWNDAFLESIAHGTGGSCMYVSNPREIQRLLTEKFNALSNTCADDLTLTFETDPNVDIVYAFRMQPEAGSLPLDTPLHLGPIQRDNELSVLFELRIRPATRTHNPLIMLDGTLETTLNGQTADPLQIVLTLPVSEAPNTTPPPPAIVEALSRLTLYRLQEKARAQISAGHYEKASDHLQHLATHLLAQGERGLARTVLLEAENLRSRQTLSEDAQKQIKYGTRALILAPKR